MTNVKNVCAMLAAALVAVGCGGGGLGHYTPQQGMPSDFVAKLDGSYSGPFSIGVGQQAADSGTAAVGVTGTQALTLSGTLTGQASQYSFSFTCSDPEYLWNGSITSLSGTVSYPATSFGTTNDPPATIQILSGGQIYNNGHSYALMFSWDEPGIGTLHATVNLSTHTP